MSEIRFCYITKIYYTNHPNLEKILDLDNVTKHSVKTHLCLSIKYNHNNVLVSLRKNLGVPDRPFGKIGYAVPSQSKPNAGLDYRYMMIINNEKYLKFDTPRISNRQIAEIRKNYTTIEKKLLNT